jgi:acyl-CoA synthetase (NDP forming)
VDEEHPLKKLMFPRSVAFMGASNHILRMGSFLLVNLIGGRFEGPVYPVHPTEETVLGLRAYKSLEELPEVPDLLVLVIPTRLVPGILDEAGALGIDRAIIVTAGYEEVGSEAGHELQQEIDRVVRKHGIRYVGPNCIGIYNGFIRLNTTPFPNRMAAGRIGMISQSGTYLSHLYPYLERLDFNFGEGISLGNAASIDLVDTLEYFEERAEIEVIAMYLEGIRRPREFLTTARRVSKKKPIVALYVGGSEGGGRAAASHTAALAGQDAVFDAAFRQAGVIRAWSIEQLLDFSWAFATQPLPAGGRMAVLTSSGGPGVSMADCVTRCGLELPAFSPKTEAAIREHLPHTGTSANPVDVTYIRDPETFLQHIPKVLLEDDEIDGLLVYGFFSADWLLMLDETAGGGYLGAEPDEVRRMGAARTESFIRFLQSFGKPVMGSTFLDGADSMVRDLRRGGIPMFPSPERAVKAMEALCRYRTFRDGAHGIGSRTAARTSRTRMG